MKKTKQQEEMINNEKYLYFSSIKYEVLKYISLYIYKKKYSPTYLDIAKRFHFSPARAGKIIKELFLLGLISKGYSAHRKIRMNDNQLTAVDNLAYNKEYPILN